MERSASEIDDLDTLVHLYWTRVFRFALASLRDPDAAGSVAQDCFLRAYRSREQFRGDCSIQSWLMRIAVNLIRDYARNRRLQFWKRASASAVDLEAVSQWIPDDDASPESRAMAREQLAAVWKAAGGLSERQRTVFLLRFVEDMDLLEIAAATGMKEGTVKLHLFRALQAVRERIGRSQ
ncbi:MAG: sigma-70 family RNA polymerase sigma factor [Bryobacteraceae bacterium]